MSAHRFATILRKELVHIVRDSRNLFLVTISPAFLLFLLSYIFSFDVGRIDLAVLDMDQSATSRTYLARLLSDPDLNLVASVSQVDQILPLLVEGTADAALVIPPDFSQRAHSARPLQLQVIVDGMDPFSASQSLGILGTRSAVLLASVRAAGAAVSVSGGMPPIQVSSQAWYNPGLKSLLSMVPGLIPVVLVMPSLALALALTREKEAGTLEGLIATPVSGLEYLLGKLAAYLMMGLVSSVFALLVAVLWFRVPFRGSLGAYLLLTADYFLACMGAILIVASFVKSQQTAMFIVLLIYIVPSFFLAGLINPVSTQSLGSMLTSYALPSTHLVEINRALFLKGLGLEQLGRPALILLFMGCGSLLLGLLLFRKKLA